MNQYNKQLLEVVNETSESEYTNQHTLNLDSREILTRSKSQDAHIHANYKPLSQTTFFHSNYQQQQNTCTNCQSLANKLLISETTLMSYQRRLVMLEKQNQQYKSQLHYLQTQITQTDIDYSTQTQLNLLELEVQKLKVQLEKSSKEIKHKNILLEQSQHEDVNTKFVECIVDMVINCHPREYFSEKPNLKRCWKFLKKIMEEYMNLKKRVSELEETRVLEVRNVNKIYQSSTWEGVGQQVELIQQLKNENKRLKGIIQEIMKSVEQ